MLMATALLLLTVTILYAGYNILVKVSSQNIPDHATTTILATVSLQVAALVTSLVFMFIITAKGGQTIALSFKAYAWAAAAGLCIGGAEIAYFYLFSGLGHGRPMAASTAIPFVVSGTILVTMVVAYFVFKEHIGWAQIAGAALVISGIYLLFMGYK